MSINNSKTKLLNMEDKNFYKIINIKYNDISKEINITLNTLEQSYSNDVNNTCKLIKKNLFCF
jgi:hypothetical protein